MKLFPARQLKVMQFEIVAKNKWQIDVDVG